MSSLIRNGRIEADDFAVLADDQTIPEGRKVIISLARWQAEAVLHQAKNLIVGVHLPNTVSVDELWPILQSAPLILLEFPAFGDGRAYSQARTLRDRYGYSGEIRAFGGAVVRDQLQAMQRCGIDAFVLRQDQDPQRCLDAFKDFSIAYQRAADRVPLVASLRRRTH